MLVCKWSASRLLISNGRRRLQLPYSVNLLAEIVVDTPLAPGGEDHKALQEARPWRRLRTSSISQGLRDKASHAARLDLRSLEQCLDEQLACCGDWLVPIQFPSVLW